MINPNTFTQLLQQNKSTVAQLKRKNSWVALCRGLLVLAFFFVVYLYTKTEQNQLGYVLILDTILFIVALRFHWGLKSQIKFYEAKILLLQKQIEKTFTSEDFFPDEIVNKSHAYAHDLDLFGKNSVFSFYNRTQTIFGKRMVSNQILSQEFNHIEERQVATKEITNRADFSFSLLAHGFLSNDKNNTYIEISNWLSNGQYTISKSAKTLSFVVPALFALSFIGTLLGIVPELYTLAIFFVNLFLFSKQLKPIQEELSHFDRISGVLKQYNKMLALIEKETFSSALLVDLQNELKHHSASQQLKQLAELLNQLESLHNAVTTALFNGGVQYHVHLLTKLQSWKKNHGQSMLDWLNKMGEIEMLISNSLYLDNNSVYTYPTFNNSKEYQVQKLGHPLISANKRVDNNLDFSNGNFIILTGSNMSGKSTFLRAIGVNIALSKLGAPITAESANLKSLPLYVSMRLVDNLAENESYFYAEIKRIQELMTEAEQQPILVLLDEILRGTNSDDKKHGTLEVIKKLSDFKAEGLIATHDLEVCDIVNDYPSKMKNMCFEAQIKENDIYFDYTLKEGICKNQSASFLMKNLGIING